jgi:hypothetical protein
LLGDHESALYVMNADGTDRQRLSRPPEPVTQFDWRPS